MINKTVNASIKNLIQQSYVI